MPLPLNTDLPQKILKIMHAQGFSIQKKLHSGPRSEKYIVKKIGTNDEFLLRISTAKKYDQKITNDLWWHFTLNKLRDNNPTLKLYSPSILVSGRNWYISELYKEDRILVRKDDAKPETIDPLIPLLARLLFQLDLPFSKQRVKLRHHRSSYLNRWLEQPRKQGLITEKEVQVALRIMQKYHRFLQPSLQHGDFAPWHLYALTHGTVGIIDAEHASFNRPRFSDLGGLYARLFTWANAPKQAARLISLFMEYGNYDTKTFTRELMPVMVRRALGTLFDAVNDSHLRDYRQAAKKLLHICLTDNLDNFLNM